MQLTPDEIKFYRELYRLVNDAILGELFVTYAKKKYDSALKSVRTKQETYEYGYANGQADAWQHIVELKKYLIDILKVA